MTAGFGRFLGRSSNHLSMSVHFIRTAADVIHSTCMLTKDMWDLLRNLLSLSHPENILRKRRIWPEANGKSSLRSPDPWTILVCFCLTLLMQTEAILKATTTLKRKLAKCKREKKSKCWCQVYCVFMFLTQNFNLKFNNEYKCMEKINLKLFHIIQTLIWDDYRFEQ